MTLAHSELNKNKRSTQPSCEADTEAFVGIHSGRGLLTRSLSFRRSGWVSHGSVPQTSSCLLLSFVNTALPPPPDPVHSVSPTLTTKPLPQNQDQGLSNPLPFQSGQRKAPVLGGLFPSKIQLRLVASGRWVFPFYASHKIL